MDAAKGKSQRSMKGGVRSRKSERRATLPDVFAFLDYREFLKAALISLSAHDTKYSHSWIASKAGFKTPQLLSMVLAGKRNLTQDRVPGLVKALQMNASESEYFDILVRLAQTDDASQRDEILKRINVAFRSGLFKELTDEGLEIFRHWYLPAMRELVTLPTFQDDPEWMAAALGISIKGNAATKHIPVIMLTALAQETVVLKGIELGAQDYIRKPFHPRELVKRLTKYAAA